jgi:MFS family permease
MLIFTTVTIDTDYTKLALIFFLLGLGMGLTMAPATTLVMDSIPADKAGVGSATNDTSREIGGALGIAIGGSVLNEYYRRNLIIPEGLEAQSAILTESFPAAIQIGLEMGNVELVKNAQLAFVEGMVASVYVAAAIAFIAAILVKRFMPSRVAYSEKV